MQQDVDDILSGQSTLSEADKLAKLNELEVELSQRAAELEQTIAELNAKKAELESAAATVEQLEGQVETGNQTISELEQKIASTEGALADANANVVALEGQIDAGNRTISELEQKITDAEQALSEVTSASQSMKAELESQLEALNADLANEKTALEQMQAEYLEAQGEFTARLEELQAYRIERSLREGESYLSTELGSVLVFDATGVEGTATIANTVESGNSMVFELVLNDQVIFSSDPIAPGESLTSIQLETPLAKGNYEALAVQKTFAKDETYVSGVRVPVTLMSGSPIYKNASPGQSARGCFCTPWDSPGAPGKAL